MLGRDKHGEEPFRGQCSPPRITSSALSVGLVTLCFTSGEFGRITSQCCDVVRPPYLGVVMYLIAASDLQ